MDINYRHAYDGTAEQVAALLSNPDFITDVATHAGATSHDVSVDGNVTRLRMSLPTPPQMRRFVDGIDMAQTFTVGEPDASGNRRVQIDVKVDKLPVKVDAQGLLKPAGEGRSEGVYTGTLNVKMPLVGRTIEKQAKPFIDDAFEGILRRAQEWLGRGA